MMSLFTSFDLFFFHFFNVPFGLSMIFFSFSFWVSNLMKSVLTSFFSVMTSFFKSIMSFKFKSLDLFLLSVMFFLLVLNFLSVLSYFFPLTSQVSLNLYLGLSSWVSLMLFNLLFNIKHVLIHFIPEGTPLLLIWFLFFVEIVSSMIRPITLVVRLVANILAGHLLMILLSKMIFIFWPFFVFYFFLNLVEFFVALIQSYIFTTMIILYFSEMY